MNHDDQPRAFLGDLPEAEVRGLLLRGGDWVADYLRDVSGRPVLARCNPNDVGAALPSEPPTHAESMDAVLSDFQKTVVPNLTHWNHPGFMAYFAITGCAPGILAELLCAGLNVNAMLWRTSPAATELEERVCDWLRQMLQLPPEFRGHINDTASSSSLVALAAARQRAGAAAVRRQGLAGAAAMTVYCSEHAHSSIDKAVITLGIGHENLRKIPSDAEFRMRPDALAAAIEKDRAAGLRPCAVVATIGTTSSTSVDPVADVSAICAPERLWLHVDAAYAGSAAICPEIQGHFRGWESADSIVVNPHKWLFTPVDCSVLWLRDLDTLREAFALTPEYLKTGQVGVTNLMDFGPQLGRRFRALKLWFVIRAFGVEGLRHRIRYHCEIARELRASIESADGFEVVCPTPFSTVCFRAKPRQLPEAQWDAHNHRLLERINADGRVFLSHTVLAGRVVLRAAIGNLRTTRETVRTAWSVIQVANAELLAGGAGD